MIEEIDAPPVSEADGAEPVMIQAAPDENGEVAAPEFGPPKHIRTTRRINGRLYVAGEGNPKAKIMFIATSLLEEEAAESQQSRFGAPPIKQKARYLKGPGGAILKDLMGSMGIMMDECYYTAMCKWLLPRANRSKPKREDIQWALESLHNEIDEVKPEIIVTLGKPVFDVLTGVKMKLSDIRGGWFYSERHKCRVFPMEDVFKPALKPEFVEAFRVDLREVKRMYLSISGVTVPEIPTDYQVIKSLPELTTYVSKMLATRQKVASIDCEWAGNNFVDGRLRSLQICHAPGKAVYIRFMDDQMNYAFEGADYRLAGRVLGMWFNQPWLKFVGHHLAADLVWLDAVLGIPTYGKSLFDTEFGQQTADEYAELGLERIAMTYTTLGRYDLELAIWCKENKLLPEEGYGRIPDKILIPYACRDVDVVMRAYPHILRSLSEQGLLPYYYNIFLPFVTDVFTSFALIGLPMNLERMEELREIFTYAREELDKEFKAAVVKEAGALLFKALFAVDPVKGPQTYLKVLDNQDSAERMTQIVAAFVGPAKLVAFDAVLTHFIEAPGFNIRSTTMMRRWLFDVKKFTPIKTTNQKEKGLPSIPWEKVMDMPPERQKEYCPSTDKQTLQILGEKDDLVQQLLRLNAVGNLCKAFLKPAQLDDEGNVVRENGLFFWVASDHRVHGQMSTTETGRPRSWKPNSLNWPSYVNKLIIAGIEALFAKRHAEGRLPERFHKYLDAKKCPIPSIRSCVDVKNLPPIPGSKGWCIVESDYKTAEIRGLGFISGDTNLIRLMTESDPQFAQTKNSDGETVRVRVSYAEDSGIAPAWQLPALLMSIPSKPKPIKDLVMDKPVPEGMTAKEFAFREYQRLKDDAKRPLVMVGDSHYIECEKITEDQLLRGPDGELLRYSYDLHWSLAEIVHTKPREILDEKKDRGAAKVGNFSSAYGASPNTLERKIESDTGVKPEEGTGQKILDGLAARQPVATAFLEAVELAPEDPGFLKSNAGRIRHFRLHPDYYGVSSRLTKSLLASLGREGRNFPMQSSVAETAARAGVWMLKHFRDYGFHARTIAILYDSLVSVVPIEERFLVAKLHQKYMTDQNNWVNHGRTWNYPTDCEFNYAWSAKPSKAEKAQLNDPTWNADPTWLSEEAKKSVD